VSQLAAHALYKVLLWPAEDPIKGKDLLIVLPVH
jgi:hypothetical protein